MRAYIQQLRQEMGVRICERVFDAETDKPSKVVCSCTFLSVRNYQMVFHIAHLSCRAETM